VYTGKLSNVGDEAIFLQDIGIVRMVPDHLNNLESAGSKISLFLEGRKPVVLRTRWAGARAGTRLWCHFYFQGDCLRHNQIEFDLESIHTKGTETVTCVSKIDSDKEQLTRRRLLVRAQRNLRDQWLTNAYHDAKYLRKKMIEDEKQKMER
jgi:hypothetical protein